MRAGALWDEVKDKLDQSAHALSGGQQQRLCIARTLAMHPDVVLFDEPCSALDPISTLTIEETIRSIAESGICVIIVTHNMEQAARVSDRTAFFYMGDMVETGADEADLLRARGQAPRRLPDREVQLMQETVIAEHQGIVGVPTMISIRDFNLWYGDFQALKNITLDIPENRVTAFIGPSGCGKSTLLRAFNRMCDLVSSVRVDGTIEFNGQDIFKSDANALRVGVGMVFQHPNPFPMSIRDNILYGPRRMRRMGRAEADELVEKCLRDAGLFDEVKDKLDDSGLGLSGGQQQRLCIARALAVDPKVLLMDEPTSALDPISTSLVEELMMELSRDHTVVVVTHNMQQASRVADKTAFFYLGELIEAGETKQLFSNPHEPRTKDYLTGRFS